MLLAVARMRQQFFLGCPPSLLKGRYRVSNSSSWLDTLEIQGQSSKQVIQLVFVSNKTLFDSGADTSGLQSLLCLAQIPNGPTLRSPTVSWRSVNGPCPAGEYKTKTIRLENYPNELIQGQPQWGEKKSNNIIHNSCVGTLVVNTRQDLTSVFEGFVPSLPSAPHRRQHDMSLGSTICMLFAYICFLLLIAPHLLRFRAYN